MTIRIVVADDHGIVREGLGALLAARPGFDLHVATVELGCRNWTGSPVFACLAHQGKAYTITANPGGCQHTPPRYDGIVLDMLMGLEVP